MSQKQQNHHMMQVYQICMCTSDIHAVITLFAVCVAGLCIITILHLFFYSVPTKVSEVRASVAVVDQVLHMEKCISRMLANMRQLSSKVDIKNV